MASPLFSPFKGRIRKRGHGQDEHLLESDIPLCEAVSEQDSNGFTHQNDQSQLNHDDVPQDQQDSSAQIDETRSTGRHETTRIFAISTTKMNAFLGIIFAMLSASAFSVGALMAKLATSVPSLEIVCMRLTLQLVFSLPAMIFFRDKFVYPWKKTGLMILRGITGVTAMALIVYSVKHMPLADARVIFYTSPVYTAILGRIFLKESITKFDIVATFLSLGGVVLIARPTFLFGSTNKSDGSKQVWFPAILAVISAIFAAVSTVLVRNISQEVGGRVVVFYFAAVGSVVSLSAAVISGGLAYPECGTYDIIYIMANGFLGYFGQLLNTKALQLEKAAIVALVRTVGIAVAFFLQLVFLGIAPAGLSISGAILVLLCNIVIFIKKCFDQKK